MAPASLQAVHVQNPQSGSRPSVPLMNPGVRRAWFKEARVVRKN